jgi:clan AA aspartic protease (TIGR02281 family)
MKVITIGRHGSNDVVINDGKVSRHHLQIVRDDAGHFRVTDTGSTNGTYVNGRKISGETPLSPGDSIRVGNTALSWQAYFSDTRGASAHKRYSRLWFMTAASIVAIIALVLSLTFPWAEKGVVVKMKREHGVRYIPAKVNGQELHFVFDTGASTICISTLEAAMLIKNGTLTRDDIVGEEQFMDATGRISVGAKINLRTVTIGGKELKNVAATVVENPQASCLLGQSVLARFGSYKIDNTNDEIIFE